MQLDNLFRQIITNSHQFWRVRSLSFLNMSDASSEFLKKVVCYLNAIYFQPRNSHTTPLFNWSLREHQQKTFATLSGFWPLRGWEGLGESVKKENLWQKFFFRWMLYEALKISEIFADVKSKIKQEMNDLVAASYKLF